MRKTTRTAPTNLKLLPTIKSFERSSIAIKVGLPATHRNKQVNLLAPHALFRRRQLHKLGISLKLLLVVGAG